MVLNLCQADRVFVPAEDIFTSLFFCKGSVMSRKLLVREHRSALADVSFLMPPVFGRQMGVNFFGSSGYPPAGAGRRVGLLRYYYFTRLAGQGSICETGWS